MQALLFDIGVHSPNFCLLECSKGRRIETAVVSISLASLVFAAH